MPTPTLEQTPTPTPETAPEQTPTPEVKLLATPDISATPLPAESPTLEISATPEVLTETVSEDLIHFGDEIEIDLVGSSEFDWRGTVDSEGFFSQLPYVDVAVYAVCHSEKEIGNALSVAYAKYFRNPEVRVRILDRSNRATATLLGAVKKEQRLSIRRPVKLNELLILSGGITENASGEVTIFRSPGESCEAQKPNEGINVSFKNTSAANSEGIEKEQRERVIPIKSPTNVATLFKTVKISDLIAGKDTANPYIRAGDLVKVEEASPVYVTGGVNAPQKVFFRREITVTRAIAAAGGLVKSKDLPQIIVYRRDRQTQETKIIEVNLTKIQAKEVPDFSLEAFDIIEITQNARAKNVRPPVVDDLEKMKPLGTLPLKIIN